MSSVKALNTLNDPLVFLREQSLAMFPERQVSGSVLMSNVAFGAAALGSGHVEICNNGNWWFIASETNWLERDLPSGCGVTDLFRSRVKFPQLGPNSYRPELYVGVYAEDVYVELNGRFVAIKGNEADARLHVGVVPPWCIYVLGCQIVP